MELIQILSTGIIIWKNCKKFIKKQYFYQKHKPQSAKWWVSKSSIHEFCIVSAKEVNIITMLGPIPVVD